MTCAFSTSLIYRWPFKSRRWPFLPFYNGRWPYKNYRVYSRSQFVWGDVKPYGARERQLQFSWTAFSSVNNEIRQEKKKKHNGLTNWLTWTIKLRFWSSFIINWSKNCPRKLWIFQFLYFFDKDRNVPWEHFSILSLFFEKNRNAFWGVGVKIWNNKDQREQREK